MQGHCISPFPTMYFILSLTVSHLTLLSENVLNLENFVVKSGRLHTPKNKF